LSLIQPSLDGDSGSTVRQPFAGLRAIRNNPIEVIQALSQ
jgi:hypothetical protein